MTLWLSIVTICLANELTIQLLLVHVRTAMVYSRVCQTGLEYLHMYLRILVRTRATVSERARKFSKLLLH